MKVLVLAAFIAVAASGQLSSNDHAQPWPWQVGRQYSYDVEAHTLARLSEGPSTGSAFRARFLIHVPSPGKLLARLQQPQRAQVYHELLDQRVLPTDLKYEDLHLEQPFEITLNGGRVQSLTLPPTITLIQENLIKGLISALQVDLSTHRLVGGSENTLDKETLQGQFKKMETDVTGDCETMYTVSPVASEWRREIPDFATSEEPIEISKSNNYGHCHYRVAYHFGVPKNAEWTGTASRPNEEQFIKRNTNSRVLVAKQGPIYKAEVITTAHVLPLQHGQQEAEVHSHVKLVLKSVEQVNDNQWQKPEGGRVIKSLLYSMTSKQLPNNERYSDESKEHVSDKINAGEYRVRRSWSPKIASINKHVEQNKQDDWSDSNESSSLYLNDEIPNNNEPAFAALYMSPQPHADKKQNQINVQKLVQDIAQGLQNSNNMPKADVLTKFNILVHIISAMSFDQLSLTSRSIEVAKSSNNIVKSDMWMVYRDAVAEAGTMPAFRQIKAWIQNKKVVGEEAAEIVASLVNTVRYPTKEIMVQFFQLAMSPEVQSQTYLNTTALIAATRFINMAQVNNETAHSYYPTHMYGRLARQQDNFVIEQVLPQLREQLSKAIEQDNSYKAQVYIKAIGNLGHRAILNVFAPYLEGKVPVSNYLRSQMVRNLQVLAHQKDKYARTVLYSILRNSAETDEVRVEAIFNIFMARPTGSMMQAMAQMTNEDPSIQVRATLKSAIESAAKLQNIYFLDLARTAQAALPIVTKENFGYQYSFKRFDDYFENKNNLGIFTVFSKTGSQESLLPQQFQYSWKNKIGGWNRESSISASTSSVQKLIQYVQLLMSQQQQHQQSQNVNSDSNHKYPADKVSQMLNIKRNARNPLEFSVNFNIMNQERFFAFDENDVSQISTAIGQYMVKLTQGVEKHYTKMLNQERISIMFPVAMGMPFIYKYKEPVAVHIQSKAKVDLKYKTEQDQYTGSMNKEIHLTFARNLDGSVGFFDTFADKYVSVGIVNKLQISLPVKLQMQIQSGQVKIQLEPLYPEQDTTILHYSVWPYTAIQKRDSLVPVAQDESTKIIDRSNKVVSVDSRIGQTVGMQFQLQGYSYSQDYRNFASLLQARDFISKVAFIFHQKDIAMTHFNFRYLAKQSSNKRVIISAVYDQLFNQKNNEGNLVNETPKDLVPNSQARREEMIKRVASGINNARVQIVDLAASFEGSQKSEYVMTAALGDSPVDKKIQYVLYAGKSSTQQGQGQINVVGTVIKPSITTHNFLEALEKELKITYNFDIKFGTDNKGNIQIQGQAERTKKYAEALVASPRGKLCAQEIAKNNLHLYACHKMIVMAHAPDHVKTTVTYKDVSPAFRYMSYQVLRYIEYLGFWNSEANPLKTTVDGKLDIEAQACYLDNYVDLALNTRTGEYRMKNVPIPRVAAGVVSTYTPFKPVSRVFNYFTTLQYEPYCAVEGSSIKTYSNRQYDYILSPAWHVVMQDEPQEIQQRSIVNNYQDKVVVLARKPNENQQEVYISYKSENGQAVEVQLKPTNVANKADVIVNTNAKKVSDAPLHVYWHDSTNSPLLQYYYLPDGVLMLNIRENRLRVAYDGQRLLIVSNGNRNNTRGICGQMSGDYRDDYQTPYGLVNKPEHFAAAFALNDEHIDPKTKETHDQAKQQAYPRQNHNTVILRSNNEWTEKLEANQRMQQTRQ